jgi:hypothetical protein
MHVVLLDQRVISQSAFVNGLRVTKRALARRKPWGFSPSGEAIVAFALAFPPVVLRKRRDQLSLVRGEPAVSSRGFSLWREAGLSGLALLLVEKTFQMC